jgi:putative hydrolase of the HAD superfamily
LPNIQAIFWDIGGVLLNNAWDHDERSAVLQHFALDANDFQARHEKIVSSFERGQLSLDEYLDRTVFYTGRNFTREQFRERMFSLSQPKPDVLAFARSLSASGKYLIATINNESRELNQYRIDNFDLRGIFRLFVSSCFVGLRKPEIEIYRLALEITQVQPEASCFIDDRSQNLEGAKKLGMKTIQMQSLKQLQDDLEALGVE